MYMTFVHLKVRSLYNFDSFVQIEDAVKKSKELGMPALALTDHHALSHLVDFFEACRKHKVVPIIGTEVFISVTSGKQIPALLFAKNEGGYKGIASLISMSHLRKGGKLYVTNEELEKKAKDVIVVLDVSSFLKEKNLEQLNELVSEIQRLKKIVPPSDLYLEINNHGLPEQNVINKRIKSISVNANLSLVATNDVHYLTKEEAYSAEMLKCSRENKKVTEGINDQKYFKSFEEMAEMFSEYPEAIQKTLEIAKKCRFNLALKGDKQFTKKTPKFKIPSSYVVKKNMWEAFTPLKEFVRPTEKEEIEGISYLTELAWKGFKKYYSFENKVAVERLKEELGVIISKQFVDYFLVIQDLIHYAKTHDVPCSVRGSVLSSLLARCLDITDLCPLEYDLKFERFLNPKRTDDPDIDIDVSQEKRYELIRYIQQKYGMKNMAQIVTFGAYGLNNAVKYAAKTLDLDKSATLKLVKMMPKKRAVIDQLERFEKEMSKIKDLKKKEQVRQEIQKARALIQWMEKEDIIKKIVDCAYKMEHIPRNTARHAAGILLSEIPILNELPVMRESDEEGEFLVVQIPNTKGQLEKKGFLKIDILGLRNIDIEDKVKKLIKQKKGIEITDIPLQDQKTFQLYQRAETTGLFQVESDGMKQASRLIQPTTINDVIALIALFRPGPLHEIERYAENKKNNQWFLADEKGEPMEGVEEILPILKDTYGVLTYQEQIYKIVQVLGNYSIAEADLLRRAISKKDKNILEQERTTFLQKVKENGKDETSANAVYDLIVRFSNYGLNKAHAAGYGLFSYRTAWLKSNYPEEYMTVLINSLLSEKKKGAIEKAAIYVKEAKRLGIMVKKPDINTSNTFFTLTNEGISFGLTMIKNVGKTYAKSIVKEREKGTFVSFHDFLSRMGKNVAIESLIKAGAFDRFGSRKKMVEELVKFQKGKVEPFYGFGDLPFLNQEDDYSLLEKITDEKELMHLIISETSVDKTLMNLQSFEKDDWIGAVVMEVKKYRTKGEKKEMAYITVETRKGTTEHVAVFPQTWMVHKDSIQPLHALLIKLKKNPQGNKFVSALKEVPKKKKVRITVPDALFNRSITEQKKWMESLNSLVQKYPGEHEISMVAKGKERKRKEGISMSKECGRELYALLGDKKYIYVEDSSL